MIFGDFPLPGEHLALQHENLLGGEPAYVRFTMRTGRTDRLPGYIYIYIYIYTHTHIHTYIYMYILQGTRTATTS